jgi:hypothetical protein
MSTIGQELGADDGDPDQVQFVDHTGGVEVALARESCVLVGYATGEAA